MIRKIILLFVLCFSFVLAACTSTPAATPSPGPELVHLQFALGYIPNIQFAPVYVAIQKGYFAAQGLEVEMVHMDENQAAALVGAGELQFAVVSGEQVLLARAQELPVVYIAAWYRQYPVSVVAKSGLPLESPADLRGLKIGLPGLYGANYIGLRALLHAGGLSEEDVTLDSIGYAQVEMLAEDRDQAVAVYTASEPVRLRSLGYEINELRVADYVDLVANGLLTNENTIRDDPDLVRRFVKGFLDGMLDAASDPEGAYRISLSFVEGLVSDDPVQAQVLATSIELWAVERPCYSDPQYWENMQSLLLEMGLLTAPLDLAAAFTNDFIP